MVAGLISYLAALFAAGIKFFFGRFTEPISKNMSGTDAELGILCIK